jgi:hypothetical protein
MEPIFSLFCSQVRDGEMVAVELVATDNKVHQKYKLWTLQKLLLSLFHAGVNNLRSLDLSLTFGRPSSIQSHRRCVSQYRRLTAFGLKKASTHRLHVIVTENLIFEQ